MRSDGTIVRGLAATRTEARRWLEAVQTHGHRTAPAQVALAATTPGRRERATRGRWSPPAIGESSPTGRPPDGRDGTDRRR